MRHPRLISVLAVSALMALLAGGTASATAARAATASPSAVSSVLRAESMLGGSSQRSTPATRRVTSVAARRPVSVAAAKTAVATRKKASIPSVQKLAAVAPKTINRVATTPAIDAAKPVAPGKQRAKLVIPARISPAPVTATAVRGPTADDLAEPVSFNMEVPSASRVSAKTTFATNQGFETGNFTGWSGNGSASVVTSHSGYVVPSGIRMAEMSSAGSCSNTPRVLTQNILLFPGETLQGFAAFHFADPNFPDYARVRVVRPGLGSITMFTSTGGRFAFETPMMSWSLPIVTGGLHTLIYEVANGGDCIVSSHALFDARVTNLSLTLFGSNPMSVKLVDLGLPSVPLAGKTVIFYLLGTKITAVTNSQGVASVSAFQSIQFVRELTRCNCSLLVEFDGDANNNGSYAVGTLF